MYILWPNNVKFNNIYLFILDTVHYMKKADHSIKILFPNIIFLTCLIYACHNVCEEVRVHCENIDRLISRENLNSEEKKYSGLPNLPILVITRLSIWINAVKYYCIHFNETKSIIEKF